MKLKTIILALILPAFTLLAQPTLTSAFDYQAVAGTANGSTSAVAAVRVPLQTFYLQSGQITNAPAYATNIVGGVTNVVNVNTNVVKASWQLTLDGTNWVTITNLYRSSTNAGIDTYAVQINSLTVTQRVVVTTSNSIPVGVFRQ